MLGETVAFQPPLPWNVNILNFEYKSTWYPETNNDRSLTVVSPATSLARDWDQKETWTFSSQNLGSPGAASPPGITSSLNVTSGLGNFSYQITASGFPTGFSASGLPPGLAIDPQTGLITGTASQIGVFNVTIGASNIAGADSKTLVLNISQVGPLAGFEWGTVATQTAGTPFTVTLRARDSGGQTVTTYNGTAQVSVQRTGAGGVLSATPVGAVNAGQWRVD